MTESVQLYTFMYLQYIRHLQEVPSLTPIQSRSRHICTKSEHSNTACDLNGVQTVQLSYGPSADASVTRLMFTEWLSRYYRYKCPRPRQTGDIYAAGAMYVLNQ